MVQFIQNFFLSPFLILLILLAVFIILSLWALQRRREYIGYGLGWLIGVFAMVVYGALVGDPPPASQTELTNEATLNVLQVIFPSIIGIVLGIVAVWMVNQTRYRGVQKSLVVALLTATSIWILFLMVVSAAYPLTQRMIGLFTLAFAIGAVSMFAIVRQPHIPISDSNAPSRKPDVVDNNPRSRIPNAPVINRASIGNRVRDRIDRRRS